MLCSFVRSKFYVNQNNCPCNINAMVALTSYPQKSKSQAEQRGPPMQVLLEKSGASLKCLHYSSCICYKPSNE